MMREIFVLLIVFLLCGIADAQTVAGSTINFAWTAPTAREDGSPASIADVKHYELSRTSVNCGNAERVVIIPASAAQIDLGPDWGEGYVFKMRVIGLDGSASQWSPVVAVGQK